MPFMSPQITVNTSPGIIATSSTASNTIVLDRYLWERADTSTTSAMNAEVCNLLVYQQTTDATTTSITHPIHIQIGDQTITANVTSGTEVFTVQDGYITVQTTGTGVVSVSGIMAKPASPEERARIDEQNRKGAVRNLMRENWRPRTREDWWRRSVKNPLSAAQAQEAVARDRLRDMVSERDWRCYVTNGYLMARGASGRWYQIFQNHRQHRIKVYERGRRVAELCIHTTDECPPTDHVISMKALLEIDEQELYRRANVTEYGRRGSSFQGQIQAPVPPAHPLVEYHRELKAGRQPFSNIVQNGGVTFNMTGMLAYG